jgi:RimJ/RimL family protein N-acetyltransferase
VASVSNDTRSPAVNSLGQPIGAELPAWTPPSLPSREPIQGRYCRLEPIDERFAADLHAANSEDADGRTWTYLPYGPFSNETEYHRWLVATCLGTDPLFHVVVNLATNRAMGVAAYLRITPASGAIEVGHIHFSPLLQRSRVATEAMYLMMKRVFALGYRRYEWKCDALNAASRAAAQRLGFSYEGIFRQATVYRNRNRDTAWYAVIDEEWPALAQAFEKWLDPSNFDDRGCQRLRLSALTRPLLAKHG